MMEPFFESSSYQFSWYAVPVLFVGAANWVLGLATLRRERGSPPSLTLLAMTLSIGLWLVGLGCANLASDPRVAEPWVKISLLGTVFVPLCAFLHAARGSSHALVVRLAGLMGCALSISLGALVLSSRLVLDEVHKYFWGYYPTYGTLGPALMVYYAIFFVAGGVLYRLGRQRTNSATERKRMRLRFTALLVAMPATVDFLATQHVGVYPFGYVFIMGFIALSTYSVWHYRLIDITPALAARQITDTMSEALLVVDRDGYIRVANDAAEGIWAGQGNLIGRTYRDLDDRWDSHALDALIDPAVANSLEVTLKVPEGADRRMIVSTSRLNDHLGAWVGTVYILHDISERWRAEAVLRESEEHFRSLVQHASDLITVIDPDTTVRYESPAIERVLGFDASATIGQRLVDVVHPDDRARFLSALETLMNAAGSVVSGEGRVQDSSGVWRHLEFTGTDQRHHPVIGGIVLNVRDVTERKQLEEQLRHQALHDPLTQLANRTRFTDRLEHALKRGVRTQELLAVIFMDLDNFKGINDSMGHPAGDALLKQVAGRLEACVRPGDTVARLGGDEFAVLLEGISDVSQAQACADRILESLKQPFSLSGKEILICASLGIASAQSRDERSASALLQEADTAMYVAKSQGRGRHCSFEPRMQSAMLERLELLADLPSALERREFLLQYQPIVLLKNGSLYGIEALVRWQHPRRGLIQPQDFITIAEESGAIIALGEWVLNDACRQGASWQDRFGAARNWTMSVNVSVHQIKHPAFLSQVKSALASSGLQSRRLILEVTESAVMPNDPSMLATLRQLKALGVGLAIDDFGTGYSSIAYLREFPFDLLKIDKSFIDDVGSTGGNVRELTRAIVELGKTLKLELVAEGIERGEQLQGLQDLDCDFGQGFLFARPLGAEDLDALFGSLEPQMDAA